MASAEDSSLRQRLTLGLAILCLGATLTAGCAAPSGPTGLRTGAPVEPEYDALFDEPVEPETDDPFENTNRTIFAGNRRLDRFVISPIARAYAFAVPHAARQAIRRVFVNLNSPAVLVNDLLQLEPGRAGRTGARFLINTTVGLAGLWDPARRIGIPGHHTDFGITLAKYGVASGPYLVLPVIGPTMARDAVGDIVDIMMLPQTWFLGPTTWVFIAYQGGDGFTLRDIHRDALAALEESSVDFYIAMRFAYLSNRAAEIQAMNLHPAPPSEEDAGATPAPAAPPAQAARAAP